MGEIRLNIDGRELKGFDGQTVLDIARESGIEIPTLCHDERVKAYGSCGICVVQQEDSGRLLRSCSTMAMNGMVLLSNTDLVQKTRKTVLELLLSDHDGDCRPPCVLACPAQTDCQGYVGLIANGEYDQALKLVMDKIPLPGSIGRVCPHPCETACRREMVEEPISIAALKRFAADTSLAKTGTLPLPDCQPETGKKVAIIGGGPGGLTAASFLRQKGHGVDVYDSMPHMGGMLRYGIPEYRLPKAVLQEEIDVIAQMGVALHNNIRIGSDMSLGWLRENFDAVIVAVGAWTSSGLRCPGEELDGVVGGIDFLREVALNQPVYAGKKIAVVGGGNTAMDACRTAVRLGAQAVYNIYRRTRDEMPAEEIEISEAEEEGVIFKYLTNPLEVQGTDGKVTAVRLQKMELGEPDASGRRRPVPIPGAEEILEVDMVIAAIGQKLNPAGLEGIELTKWNTIAADETTFRTSLEGVFAVGDATNNGADIAITAIGEAQKSADVIDRYLYGEEVPYRKPYVVTSEPAADAFSHYDKKMREKLSHRAPDCRRNDFMEMTGGLTEEQALREANRCLECGCHDFFECKLIEYANQYNADPAHIAGEKHNRPLEDIHPFIHRNPDKCILCGLCVRVCDEAVGVTALGLIDRGFDAMVKPALGLPLNQSGCIACGQCVHVCPTGALTEIRMTPKQVPTKEQTTRTTCSFCSVGCNMDLTHNGKLLLRALPVADRKEDALLCMKGRFGFGEIARRPRIETPQLRQDDGSLKEVEYAPAMLQIVKRMQSLRTMHGDSSIGVAVSDRYTSEEIFLIKELAQKALHTNNVFSFGKVAGGIADVLGADRSTADFDQLKQTDLVLLVQSGLHAPHLIAGLAVRSAVQNGAQLVVLNNFNGTADELTDLSFDPGTDLELLREVLAAAIEICPAATKLPGFDALAASLAGVLPSADAKAIAKTYCGAKKAVIVFEENKITAQAAHLLANLALVAGHCYGARNGIVRLKPNANSQGLADLGVRSAQQADIAALKGLLVFGEDCAASLPALEFLAVQELQMTETAQKADVILPARSFAESDGTFVNSVGGCSAVCTATQSPVAVGNAEQLLQMASIAGHPLPYRGVQDVAAALNCCANNGNAQKAPALLPVAPGALCREAVANTNALYNSLMAFAEEKQLV